jgi:hypothetical protein
VDEVAGGGEQQGGEPHEWGEAIAQASPDPPGPGDIILGSGPRAMSEPLVGKDESTPLEDDEPEGVVPPCPLWAMKGRRHIQWHLLPSHERHERVRDCVGSGDDAIYVIDDGGHHVMLGRRLGARAGECEYCLIGRVPRERYDGLRQHAVAPADAFDGATGITVCAVADEGGVLSSNVFDVARYDDAGEIPAEYRPGAPFLELAEDLEITVD